MNNSSRQTRYLSVRFFGSYHKERVARISVLLDGLRESGCRCEEMNVRLPLTHDQRLAMLKAPWKAIMLPWVLAKSWIGLIRKRLHSLPVDVVIVPYMGHFDIILARLLHPHTLIVLDHLISAADTAKDRRSGPIPQKLLSLLDSFALMLADIAMIDTEEHKILIPLRYKHKVIVVPIGAPRVWYTKPIIPNSSRLISIVFFGLFTPLQGSVIIAEALNILTKRNISFQATLIGRGQDYQSVHHCLHDNINVRWIDWLNENKLVEEVAAHDICLGIFGESPKANRVVPQKLFLGAAAGCALLTSDTPPQRHAFSSSATYVPQGSAEQLADCLTELSLKPQLVCEMRMRAKECALKLYQPNIISGYLVEHVKTILDK